MDYAVEAQRHRHMAEEYRTMADVPANDGLRVQYRSLAQAYDRLADDEERAARNLNLQKSRSVLQTCRKNSTATSHVGLRKRQG